MGRLSETRNQRILASPMFSSGKVVLFFPSYGSREASPPLALISIAAPLLQAGFEVKIVDQTLEPDSVTAVVREMEDALCLGISIITGPMIQGAVEVGRAVKAAYPDKPIVLGGWHPSILPEQTLAASFVDVVVIKQGEFTFLELVRRFNSGLSSEGVAGTLWKKDGELTWNPLRHYPKVAELPSRIPGYDLVPYDQYESQTGLRWVMYSSSHGCPYNCSYCSNASVYGRNLDLLPVEQVIDEITYLVRKHRIGLLGIIDDIFFAFRDRCLQIAEGLARSGLQFQWYIQDRVDCWSRLTQKEARLYRRAGLVRVHFGAESGSETVLRSIDKKAPVAATLKALDRCTQADIRASFGFIFGLPEEAEVDLQETVRLIDAIYSRSEKADCYTNIFTPYPGSPLWPVSVKKGFVPPSKLEEWIQFYPRITRLPWLSESQHQRLQVIRECLRFGYHQVNVGEKPYRARHRLLLKMLQPISKLRVQHHYFELPWEVYSYWTLKKLRLGLNLEPRF